MREEMLKTTKIQTRVVSFRATGEDASRFEDAVKTLGVSDSEMARRAFLLGFDQACGQIAAEKRTQAEQIAKRFGFKPVNSPKVEAALAHANEETFGPAAKRPHKV
jgi:hypothetical protein